MNEENLSRFLAIDFGLKRVGVAVSDPLKIFATSLTTLQNNNELINNLSSIIEEKNIKLIVLGIPSDEDNSKTSIVQNIRAFKEKLINKFNLEIIEWDETYTSVIAENMINESVRKKKSRKEKSLKDMNAAAVILQEYLDSLK